MSDNIAWHCYTHSETEREKEIRTKRRTYTHTITANIKRHWERQRERERETRIKTRTSARTISGNIDEHWEMYWERKRERNTDQETEIYTYNQWQYSRTLLQISKEKDKNKHDQETYMHIQSVITYPDTGTNIQSQREIEIRISRRTYTRRINNNTHIF